MTEVSALERQMVEEQWLPESWLVKHGPVMRDRRDGLVLLHRGWNSVMETTVNRGGDLTTLRAALIELAAAAVKVVADVDGYLTARVGVAADVACDACGVIPPAVPRRPAPDDVDEDEPADG